MENNHHRGFIGFQCGYFAFLLPLSKARIDPAKMIATKSQCTEGLVSLKVPQAAAGCDIGCVPVTQVGFRRRTWLCYDRAGILVCRVEH